MARQQVGGDHLMGTGRSALMIDENGYRSNVGIVLANAAGQVLWARRVGGRNAWQFPQGGVNQGETPEQAVYRDAAIAVDHSAKPEFDQWCWVSYYYPISQIIDFKREVYRQALVDLAPHLPVLTNHA